jgi:curved DNA-binding protein CbpA
MGDPFEFLAAPRSATVDDFKKSLRLLAKKLHPDAHQNNPKSGALFPEIKAAHEILGDEAKHRAFDRGEADADAKSMPEASAIAISGFAYSMTALVMAVAIIVASPLIVRSVMPQMGINATSDGGHPILPRVVANEERRDPRLWSELRLLFRHLPESSADKAFAAAAPTDQSAQNTPDSQHDNEPIELLIGCSEKLLSEGDVGAARILLRRAAEAHDARAALALGATYDPIMLAVLQAHGVAADVSLALDWYEKASGFGSREAQERLRLLATVLVEPKRRIMRAPIHGAASHDVVATPRVAAPSRDHNGGSAAPSIRPQLVRDDASQKLPPLLGISF